MSRFVAKDNSSLSVIIRKNELVSTPPIPPDVLVLQILYQRGVLFTDMRPDAFFVNFYLLEGIRPLGKLISTPYMKHEVSVYTQILTSAERNQGYKLREEALYTLHNNTIDRLYTPIA